MTAAPSINPADCKLRWAADLVPALRQSGTGEAKLAVIAEAMVARHNDPKTLHLPDRHPARHLTAAEAVGVLAADERTAGLVTVEKARQLALTGVYVPPPAASPVTADRTLPPPPDDLPPARASFRDTWSPGRPVTGHPAQTTPPTSQPGTGPKQFTAPTPGTVEGPGRVTTAGGAADHPTPDRYAPPATPGPGQAAASIQQEAHDRANAAARAGEKSPAPPIRVVHAGKGDLVPGAEPPHPPPTGTAPNAGGADRVGPPPAAPPDPELPAVGPKPADDAGKGKGKAK